MVVYDKMQPKILWQDSGRVRDREGRCFRNCSQKMTGNLEGALNLLVFVSCLAESLRSLHAEWLFCIKSPCVFSGVPVAGSHESLDPTVTVMPCAGQGIPGLILTSQVIPLPVFLPSGVFQLSQFWRLIHRQALGSGNWWGCCGRPFESPLRFC